MEENIDFVPYSEKTKGGDLPPLNFVIPNRGMTEDKNVIRVDGVIMPQKEINKHCRAVVKCDTPINGNN